MNRYLLVDLNSDYKEIMSYKGLKELLVETIRDDMLSNHEDYDIVNNCYKDLEKMIKEDISMNWLSERLESYSYKIIDLLNIQYDLDDIRQYFEKQYFTSAFNEVIDKINDEVNK